VLCVSFGALTLLGGWGRNIRPVKNWYHLSATGSCSEQAEEEKQGENG